MKHSRVILALMALFIAIATFYPAASVEAASGGTYKCAYLSQSPKDWTKYNPRDDFDARFTLLNTGTANWGGVDVVWIGGRKMHTKADRFDIPKAVMPEGTVNLYIDMEAPKTKGTHITYWGLTNGSRVFCRFYLIITVK